MRAQIGSFCLISFALAAMSCGGGGGTSGGGSGTPPSPTQPGPTAPSFTGTYNVTMTKVSDQCSDPLLNTGPWTTTLQGTADALTVAITALGTQNVRRYTGAIQTDGSFTASATFNVVTGRWRTNHDTSGNVQGRVSGNNISGTENLTFMPGACDRAATAVLAFSGSK